MQLRRNLDAIQMQLDKTKKQLRCNLDATQMQSRYNLDPIQIKSRWNMMQLGSNLDTIQMHDIVFETVYTVFSWGLDKWKNLTSVILHQLTTHGW